MNISDILRAETAQSHQSLEKIVVRQIREIQTTRDYINLLGFFYSYFESLEVLINEYISLSHLPDLYGRRKAGLISLDLISLGALVPQRLESDFLPEIKNQYQAFGALYVIEGSSLGGVHIAKMIHKKLPEAANSFLFFTGYGERTSEMWTRFKNVLDSISGNHAEINNIISGARETFVKFSEWINSNIKSPMLT